MSSNKKVSNDLGDRKEAVGTTISTEKKSFTKDAEKVLKNWQIRYCLRINLQQMMLRNVLTNWQISCCLKRNP